MNVSERIVLESHLQRCLSISAIEANITSHRKMLWEVTTGETATQQEFKVALWFYMGQSDGEVLTVATDDFGRDFASISELENFLIHRGKSWNYGGSDYFQLTPLRRRSE